MQTVLADTETRLTQLEQSALPSWDELVVPYERLGDDMERAWGQISHLKSVKDSEPLRTAHAELQVWNPLPPVDADSRYHSRQ